MILSTAQRIKKITFPYSRRAGRDTLVTEALSLCLSVTALLLFFYIPINRSFTRNTVTSAKKGDASEAEW